MSLKQSRRFPHGQHSIYRLQPGCFFLPQAFKLFRSTRHYSDRKHIFSPQAIFLTILRLKQRAQYLLRRTYRVQPGDTLLIHAAAGGVGLIVCQWAKALGATVIGTVSSDEKAELARQHGCDHPIVTSREKVSARVREITFLGNRCRMSFELNHLPGHALTAEVSSQDLPRLGTPDIFVALPPGSLQVFA